MSLLLNCAESADVHAVSEQARAERRERLADFQELLKRFVWVTFQLARRLLEKQNPRTVWFESSRRRQTCQLSRSHAVVGAGRRRYRQAPLATLADQFCLQA